ncbi:DnaJ domain-containing protein [uncultured Nitratireductor sp.]|uniref:DnaJ domain-containing protein n=1 Tax=uncultured Nitratireductor sp. TaxID=520953 RepID=UPI0025CCB01B|nr:DnaJ domain-containing protein [uncultured Nitratireductor sp.]
MTFPFFFFALLLLLVLSGMAFMNANPKGIANAVRIAGPSLLALAGVVMLFAGRAGIGGMLISAAVAWFGSGRLKMGRAKTPGQSSNVRTAALEMELDHDSGRLSGVVLAGRHEGRRLGEMTQEELLSLYGELASDEESLRLLETYLDSEFPTWRDSAQANGDRREGTAPGAGPMTEEEAYEILGLERGATVAQIREAHRRLMQRLHPDMGGTSSLAARINEARDVLLSAHS